MLGGLGYRCRQKRCTGMREKKVLGKQIQEKIHDTKVPGYSQLRLSVSIGGVLSVPGSTVENAIHKADQFMYQAKTCKNMVVTEHDEEVQDNAEGGETSKTYKYRILR